MHQALTNHIDGKIYNASRFVLEYMPLDINIDNAYEAMLACCNNHTPEMIAAFQVAVQYLSPSPNYKTFNMGMENGRVASLRVRFTPTVKWPTFLIPEGNLVIDPHGHFAALLDTPIRVAAEWETLSYLWKELCAAQYELDAYILAYLMPWIRECLADFDIFGVDSNTSRQERRQIERELSMVMNDWNITRFPRMSKPLTNIARSGRHLFAQYQMIESAYSQEGLLTSPITVTCTPSLVESWVREHISEMRTDWATDLHERRLRQMDEAVEKAAKKFDKANPQGK